MTNECEHDALDIAAKLRTIRTNSRLQDWDTLRDLLEAAAGLLQRQNALRLQAEHSDRRAVDLQNLIRRMEQTNRIRAERKVRSLEASHHHLAILRREDGVAVELDVASHHMRGAKVSERAAEVLRVGAITQREQDLIELAIAYTLDLPELKAFGEAFTMSCQQPNPPAGGE